MEGNEGLALVSSDRRSTWICFFTNSSIPRFGWIRVKCCLGCTTYDHFSGLAFSISRCKIGVWKRRLCFDVDPVRRLPECKCTHESNHDSLFPCCVLIEYFIQNSQPKFRNFERYTHWSLGDYKHRWSSVPMLCASFFNVNIEAMKTHCHVSNRRKFRSETSDNMDRSKAEQGRGREERKIIEERRVEERERERERE